MALRRIVRIRRNLRRAREALLASSKQSIMWLLLLLVALSVAGMWILSSLNLEYSQRALAKQRRAQIEETFLAGLNRITERQRTLERYTEGLARLGELVQRQAQQGVTGLKPTLQRALKQKLRDFQGASGIGIWCEPGVLSSPGKPAYAPYLYRDGENLRALDSGAGRDTDFRHQPWYRLAFPKDWSAQQHVSGRFYWTPAYFNNLTNTAVLTVASPMFDANHRLIGMVTGDWESEQIIDLVSRVEVTPNSFSFLIDSNNRKLSSLSRTADAVEAQRIMDAVVNEHLASALPPGYNSLLATSKPRDLTQTRSLSVDGRDYELYFAGTPAGMLFGVGVPQDEIDAVLVPMRDSNYRILLVTGLVVLLLSCYLVYRIAGLMRELQASYTDALTGLPNRARLLQTLERSGGGTLTLINLDRFKEINSLFGHLCGDEVLVTLGRRLLAFVSRQKPLRGAQLYRLTGDEFALFGPEVAPDQLPASLQTLSDFLQDQRLVWQDQEINVGATVGVSSHPLEENDAPDSLLSQATVALRLARRSGHNFEMYDTEQRIEQVYEQNLYWAKRVKEALQTDAFTPWFQPIIDNRTGEVVKYECLVRMLGEDGEVVSPGLFLGVAHKLRLGRQITRIMVERCFEMFADQPYEFSINLSYADIVDEELTTLIRDRLRDSGIGSRVIFEILESVGIENYSEVRRFIDEVKAFGARIAIDDFGTGYSNFSHLLRLEVDLIKIDGSLIRHLHEDPTVFTVTQGIVQFARSLGIGTVAEFVHSAEVQQQVLALGIDFSQGAYFGMPAAGLVRPAVMPAPGRE